MLGLRRPAGGGGAGGRLEEVVAAAGLTIDESEVVDCPMEFADAGELARGMLAPGPAVMAARLVGEDRVRETALTSLAPFRTAGGGYRLENTFRYVIAVG